ncbi:MAG: hypothetical protein JSV88_06775 [Candidatus Aminicenantes bacterium]|nr:MAG: hypothetical protein JSV88_06775 [Candidatus Aminicenantes bacterium]
MPGRRTNYIIKVTIIPILLASIVVTLSIIFPKIQSISVFFSLAIALYFGIIFAIYNSYDSLKDRLFQKFDSEIKDAIAKNRIVDTEEFGEKFIEVISGLTLNFGVDAVIFKAIDSDYLFSDREKITKNISINDYEKFADLAQKNEELKILRKKSGKFDFKYKSILLVPMVFAGTKLGYFALCSFRKVFRDLDIWLYSTLENLFIDDPFYSLKDKRIKNKIISLEVKIDKITNQVASGKIEHVDPFITELSKIITEELGCSGGYFHLKKTGSFTHYPKNLKLDISLVIHLEKVFLNTSEAQLIDKNDPNFSEKLPYPILIAIPIIFEEEYKGNFGVLLSDRNRADEIKGILDHIEDSVIDNYVHMLTKKE